MIKAVNESEKLRVAFDCIGCKLNRAEAEFLSGQFARAGYLLVPPTDEADIYILNTCTVTHVADRKSRHWLRRTHRRHPGSRLVAIGCYAERAPEELGRLPGVSLVVGNEQKQHLLELLEAAGCQNGSNDTGRVISSGVGTAFRTRAFIKAQDGCNNFCSYCIVPLVRGREENLPADDVVAEVRKRVDDGYKEVVITGTEVGSYSFDGLNLKGLLERILAETGVARLRLSSLQPQEISTELIGLWRDERLCRHFHLSLQSGSDGVLGRMKRHYTVGEYRRAVSLIRGTVPDTAITTDIIVGFPGETETEFQESYEFCRQMGFARIHVFPYSPRPGTEAALMRPMVSDKVKKLRSQCMLVLAEESARDFGQRFLGRTVTVLWEQKTGGVWSGYTDNYIKVYVRKSEDLSGKLLPVKLAEVYKDGMWGAI